MVEPVRRPIHETPAVGRPDSAMRFDLPKVDSGKSRGDVGRVSSDGKRARLADEEEEEEEDDQVTSLRSRVRRRASSRCQIYRRVLDGACPRLLISPTRAGTDADRSRIHIIHRSE